MQHEKLLDVQQVRKRLNCSKSYVYALIDRGELLCIKLGKVKGYRIPEEAVDQYMAEKSDTFRME